MIPLSDYQVMYGNLLMGPGTTYDVNWATLGLLDLPPIRAADSDRPRGDGVWQGEEFAGAQTFPLSVQMFGWQRIPVDVAVRTFLDETTPMVPRDLWFKVPHLEEPRCLLGVKVRRRHVPVLRAFDKKVTAQLDWFAPDATRYGALQTLVTEARDGAVSSVAGVNHGSLDAWPRFRLTRFPAPGRAGGFAQPVTIFHHETGSVISIHTTVAPQQELIIDPATGTALVDGVLDRGADVSSRDWWAIPPHGSFTAELVAQDGVRMDVEWRTSWW